MPGASDPAEAPGAAEEGERPKERAALAPKLLVRNTALTEAGQMDAFVMRLPPTTDRAQARVSSKRARGEPAGGIVAALGNLGGPPPAGDAEGLPRTVRKRARARKECNLSSVKALLAKVEREAHEGLTELMREHAFVGCASEMAPLLQQGTKLFLVDLPPLTREAAYQACLRRFGDLDRIALDPPAPVRRLVRAVLDAPESGWAEGDGDKDEIAAFVARLLLEDKAEMLDAYFGLRFARDAGTLEAVPELIDNYLPDRALLPMFLLRLAVQVDWSNEERCFQGVASELAEWYMVRPGRPWADMLPAELRAHAQHSAAEEWGAEKVPPPPPPPPRTKWTRRVPHPVLIGHAVCLVFAPRRWHAPQTRPRGCSAAGGHRPRRPRRPPAARTALRRSAAMARRRAAAPPRRMRGRGGRGPPGRARRVARRWLEAASAAAGGRREARGPSGGGAASTFSSPRCGSRSSRPGRSPTTARSSSSSAPRSSTASSSGARARARGRGCLAKPHVFNATADDQRRRGARRLPPSAAPIVLPAPTASPMALTTSGPERGEQVAVLLGDLHRVVPRNGLVPRAVARRAARAVRAERARGRPLAHASTVGVGAIGARVGAVRAACTAAQRLRPAIRLGRP